MKIALRHMINQTTREREVRGLVLETETEEESEILDVIFGRVVDKDGLIGKGAVECRLSDGYAEHYLYVPAVAEPERRRLVYDKNRQKICVMTASGVVIAEFDPPTESL